MKKLFILFLLCSCAPQIENKTLNVESDFQIYLDEFETISKVHYDGGINFASSGSLEYYQKDSVAICIIYRSGNKEIKVDRGYWIISDETVKEQLIFHELGHCALGRQHKNELMIVNEYSEQTYMPQSIMYPSSFGGQLYYILREYYISELLDESKGLTTITL